MSDVNTLVSRIEAAMDKVARLIEQSDEFIGIYVELEIRLEQERGRMSAKDRALARIQAAKAA